MAKFPYSYGSLEITKYPNSWYLNVTLPNGETVPCVVLPVSEKWMRLYADKNNKVHADLSINLDDASGLNRWAAEQDKAAGKNHTDFHAQIHLTPTGDARKAWQKSLEQKYDSMMPDELDKELQKLKLDKTSLSQSDYYRQHPDRMPTREQLVSRLAQNDMQRLTAAGRIFSPDLTEVPPPAPVSVAPATMTAGYENIPGYNPNAQAAPVIHIDEEELPF